VAIAEHHGNTVGQVLFRWLVQRGVVALAKSVRKERMLENLAAFGSKLTEEDLTALATLETGTSSFFSHRDTAIVKWMSERKLGLCPAIADSAKSQQDLSGVRGPNAREQAQIGHSDYHSERPFLAEPV
jgi:hypothetical protein